MGAHAISMFSKKRSRKIYFSNWLNNAEWSVKSRNMLWLLWNLGRRFSIHQARAYYVCSARALLYIQDAVTPRQRKTVESFWIQFLSSNYLKKIVKKISQKKIKKGLWGFLSCISEEVYHLTPHFKSEASKAMWHVSWTSLFRGVASTTELWVAINAHFHLKWIKKIELGRPLKEPKCVQSAPLVHPTTKGVERIAKQEHYVEQRRSISTVTPET